MRKASWGLGGLAALFHIVVAYCHGGPVAVPDVSVYLSFAQWVHGGVLPENPAFHPGYGLTLFAFGGLNGSDVHTAALVFNSLLAGLCVPLVVGLATRHGVSRWVCWMAAGLVVVHPSISLSSRIGWPEPMLLVLLLVVGHLIDDDKWSWAGLVAGLSVAVHPRFIVVLIAVSALAPFRGRLRVLLVGLSTGAILSSIALTVTDSWPTYRVAVAGSFENGLGAITTISGQFLAFGAGTIGLGLIGMWFAIFGIAERRDLASSAFFGLSALMMLFLGGWVLAGSDRADIILYNRYMGPWALPLAVLGLVAISRGAVNKRCVITISTISVVAMFLCLASVDRAHSPARRIMTLDLGVFWQIFQQNLVTMIIVAAALSALGVAAASHSIKIPIILLFTLALTSSLVDHAHLRNVGRIADGQAKTAQLVPDGTACLAHDMSVKSYAMWLYRLHLPKVEHRRVDLQREGIPCSQYVVAATGALRDCPRAQLLAKEPLGNWGLWRYPTGGCA